MISYVNHFKELIETPFNEKTNALCWNRKLNGNFSEIVEQFNFRGNIKVIKKKELQQLQLNEEGEKAKAIILQDWKLLEEEGAMPVLNIIKKYERDDEHPFFPTDVYSFHVDSSPIPSSTILCTYFGDASELIPNSQALQKIKIPEIRQKLRSLYKGKDSGFEQFLSEHFYNLHYQALPDAQPINFGIGNLWRIAIEHPGSNTLPCVHRAPFELSGQKRLLMIC